MNWSVMTALWRTMYSTSRMSSNGHPVRQYKTNESTLNKHALNGVGRQSLGDHRALELDGVLHDAHLAEVLF